MMSRTMLGIVALGLLAACASTVSDRKVYEEFPPKAADAPVEVWIDGDAPGDVHTAAGTDYRRGPGPADMIKVAEFHLRKGAKYSWQTLFGNGREETRRLGGDGFVVHWLSGMTITAPRVRVTVFRDSK